MKSAPQPKPRGFTTQYAPQESDLYKCVQCGFCLNACPTYLETGLEAESPRGRLTLMKAVNEGRLELTPQVTTHWDLCLQCRACEVACPSGVPYGRIMMSVRAEMKERVKRPWRERVAREIGFNRILKKPFLMRMAGRLTGVYQRSGMRAAVKRTNLLRLLPSGENLDAAMPQIESDFFRADGRIIKPTGPIKARVSMLAGCVMTMMHANALEAAVRVLAHNGVEVHIPDSQGCCGSLNFYAGERKSACEMAINNIEALLSSNPDFVVSASAGCGSTMKEYGELMPEHDTAESLARKTRDLHELLVEVDIDAPRSAVNQRVVFQDPCHLLSTQRISDAPRQVLRSIPGLERVDMAEPAMCCGSAGTYSAFQPVMSGQLGDRKARNIMASGADIVATANPGCALQLKNALQRAGSEVRVAYACELLDEAYASGGDYD